MNKKINRKILSLLLSLAMLVSLFAGLSLTASAATLPGTPTGYTAASQVNYVTVSGKIANWGARGETATFLTTYAQNYYTGQYSYATLSANAGGTTQNNVTSSALYSALRSMVQAKQTSQTSYDGTRDLYKYTDCVNSNYSYISSFYSGTQLNGAWDSGSTWNREHTWPNSKGNDDQDNDIMMLRPTSKKENSDRGNTAYGESSGYYHPNQEANGSFDLRGDCARIVLYCYVRWSNQNYMWGSSGVIESKDVLLDWMEADPVDTWEMGRNDAVQSITGVRNVFVDYPELAFQLFSESVPSGYATPSGGSSTSTYTVTATSNNTNYGTASASGSVITASPKTGYTYDSPAYTVVSGTATVTQNGNTFIVNASSDCTVRINFTAKTTVTVTLSENGTTSTQSVYAGDPMSLSGPITVPTGYSFVGWVTSPVAETQTKPSTIYTETYTPYASTTLYALYSYTDSAGSGSGDGTYTKFTDSLEEGDYVICSDTTAMKNTVSNNRITYTSVTVENNTISDPSDEIVWHIAPSGSYWTIYNSTANGYAASNGVKNNGAIASSGSDDKSLWTVSGSFEFVNKYNSAKSINANLRYNPNVGFGTYSTSTGTALTLYKGSTGTKTYMTSIGGSAVCPPHEHTENISAVAATCTQVGYTAGVFCIDCETYISGHEEVAALGHDYTYTPDSNHETHTVGCSRCNYSETASCDYATSVSGTTVTHTCADCGDVYTTQLATYTVTYNDCGAVASSASCVEGGSVTLPATGSTVTGYTFEGWVAQQIDPEDDEEPAILTGPYTPEASVTLYAVYSRTEDGGTPADATVGNTGSDSTNENGSPYNFYYKYTTNEMLYTAAEIGGAGTITALGFYVASTSGEISPEYVNIYLTTTSGSSLSKNTPYYASDLTPVYSGAPTMGSSTGWEMLTLDTPFDYNGTDNLVVVTTQHIDPYDSGVKYRVSSATNMMIYRQNDTNSSYGDASAVVSSGGWNSNGFYAASKRPAVKFTLNTATTYYTTSPYVAPTLKIESAAPVLNGKIDMTYTVTVPTGYTNPYMVFTFNGVDTEVRTYTTAGDHLKFTFTGVNPQCMGDDITATLYATKDGNVENVSVANYSVRDYCVDKLALTGDDAISTELRTLLSDMLAYGAAAQTYTGHKANANELVTYGVTGTSYSSFSALTGNAASLFGTADGEYYWISAGLTLTDSVAMNFRFYAASTEQLTVSVCVNNREQTFSEFTAVSGETNVYEVSFTGVSVEEFGADVTASFELDGTQRGKELTYSVNTYVQSKQSDAGNAALAALVQKLYNYGASAAAYVSANNG